MVFVYLWFSEYGWVVVDADACLFVFALLGLLFGLVCWLFGLLVGCLCGGASGISVVSCWFVGLLLSIV